MTTPITEQNAPNRVVVSPRAYLDLHRDTPASYRGTPLVRVSIVSRMPQLGYLRGAISPDSPYAFKDVALLRFEGGSKPVQIAPDEACIEITR